MVKIAVSGALGKMGRRIINLIGQDADLTLVAALEQKGHSNIGTSAGGVKVSDNPADIKEADCLIEFSTPQATLEHLDFALRHKKPMIIGTTGLNDQQKNKIKNSSRHVSIVFSPNMSVGVNIFFNLVKEAAEKLGTSYTVDIVEAHHVHKKDAPSGTAKRLAEVIKSGSGTEVRNIKSIREDEIVGDHRLIFESEFDRIELLHSAKTRDIFARGALEAAKWIIDKPAGLYTMQDVLKR